MNPVRLLGEWLAERGLFDAMPLRVWVAPAGDEAAGRFEWWPYGMLRCLPEAQAEPVKGLPGRPRTLGVEGVSDVDTWWAEFREGKEPIR